MCVLTVTRIETKKEQTMLNTTLQINNQNVTFNSVAGTIVKSCDKSKIVRIRANSVLAQTLFDEYDPYIKRASSIFGRKGVSVLQVMLCANDYLLVEFIELEEDL